MICDIREDQKSFSIHYITVHFESAVEKSVKCSPGQFAVPVIKEYFRRFPFIHSSCVVEFKSNAKHLTCSLHFKRVLLKNGENSMIGWRHRHSVNKQCYCLSDVF